MNLINAQAAWVIPEQLRRARESLGLSVGDAAEKIGIPEDELRDWEAGKGSPTLPDLRRLSEAYKRSARFFFVGEEPLPLTDYRVVPLERRAVLSPEARAALVDFENLCHRSWEVEQILEIPTEPQIQWAKLSEDAEDVAARERKSLERVGLRTTAPPLSRLTYRQVFMDYRRVIEKLGVRVFGVEMPVAEVRGASWWHAEYGPAILVSRRDWLAPRLFTLAHEYAHIILHERGTTPLCDMKGEAETERFANRFSAGLLVPVEAFWDTLRSRGWANRGDWDDPALKSLAGTFKVSRDVVAIRLEEMGLAARGFYRWKRAEWERELPERPWYPKGPKRPGWRIHIEDALGPRYEELVFSAFRGGHLTWADLTRYLGLRVKEVEEWLKSREALGSSEGQEM